MSEIIERNKLYLVKSKYGAYTFNNRKTAETLNKHLNNYETITKQHTQTTKKLNQLTKDIKRLNITISTLHNEITEIRKELDK